MFGNLPFSSVPLSSIELVGAQVSVAVDAAGVSCTTQIGSVATTAAASTNITGLEATGAVNDVTVIGEANVTLTG
jgi:hypothetical protein